jgi:hypothetical protein
VEVEPAGEEIELPQRPPRRERKRRRRRRLGLLAAVWVVVIAVVFFVGLVVGRALEDAPKPGGEQTIVQTLVPDTIGPAQTVTVTVTTSSP